jgi:MarR family transcriptional regulator for hemolysin
MTTVDRYQARESFGIALGQLARLWRAEIDRRLAPHGFSEARWLTLLHLSRLGAPATQKRLAAAAGVQEPTLVRMLDRLESEGLVQRSSTESDRRAKTVHLTEKATPDLARIQQVTKALRDENLAEVSDAELDTCLRVFERLADHLRRGTPARGI